jgi:oligoribonuclease NrnB/cAMP/cGMP phosphodiesterase (DHH superfamily)
MNEIIDNYKHDVLRKLVSAQVLMDEPETVEAYHQFLKRIKSDPLPVNRTETVKDIVKKLYDEKTLIDFFDHMFLPIAKQMVELTGRKISDKELKVMEKSFAKKMRDINYNELLFMTRDFEMNELDELDDVSGSSATNHETRAVFDAVVYAMNEAMSNMVKRFSAIIQNAKHKSSDQYHPKKSITASPATDSK